MRTILTRTAGLAAIFLAALVGVAAPVAAAEQIVVVVDPPTADLRLGETTTLTITVTNNGDAPTGRLAVHIDVTSPTGSGSVDPEDWTATLTRRIDSIDPGTTRRLDWRLQPISGGSFVAYAVALPVDGGTDVFASNGVSITVEERRSLNPEGVLPVAVGAPAVVGVLLLGRVRRGRRK
ncbi:MAG: hypothetical protein DHS20C19_20830 [Acidimicrobiales bacterium]|nr:MAG: hypothetical protein DHS20C19_20830 [Acidimicrobiales bacterium]